MLWQNTTNSIQEESMDIMECASLISNNFTLNSTSPSAPNHRQQLPRNRSLNYSSHNNTEKPTMGLDDLSFYDEKTTEPRLFSTQIDDDDDDDVGGLLSSAENSPLRFHVSENMVLLEKYDSNSFDSGYSCSQNQKQIGNQKQFKFAEPKLPTKKLSFLDPSPRKQPNFKIFHSLSSSSTESIDDDLDLDLIEMESIESTNSSTFPSNLNSLISGHIKSTKPVTPIKMNRPQVRRCLSLTNDNIVDRSALLEPKTPEFILKKSILLNTPSSSKERCFKRPEPPSFSPVLSKRYKIDDNKENSQLFLASKSSEKKSVSNSNSNETENGTEVVNISRVLRKSMSLNDAQIMTALARSSSEPDLIGDFSKPFSLPLMGGKHQDLKSISVNTMAQLLNGEFDESIGKFKIIDCRYPYEYEGGHIRGAQNLYTHEQILEELVNCKTEAPTIVQSQNDMKRNILIFHCEFSSERGPKLSRFLRNHDRLQNSNSYPALHYPEIYLLHGGYKEFYEFYSQLCDPVAYRPMLEPSFCEQYRHFRAKSKSWNGDIKSTASKYGLKKSRSRLVL